MKAFVFLNTQLRNMKEKVLGCTGSGVFYISGSTSSTVFRINDI